MEFLLNCLKNNFENHEKLKRYLLSPLTPDYEKIKIYNKCNTEAAKQYHAYAQYLLSIYYRGTVLYEIKDYDKCFYWAKESSKLNNPFGISSLGVCYKNGYGVSKDYSIAFQLFKRASDLGNSDGMYKLGSCYMYGEGAPQDFSRAIKLYKKSCDLGNSYAMYQLGVHYFYGDEVVSKDLSKSFEYYQKASDFGNEYAKKILKRSDFTPFVKKKKKEEKNLQKVFLLLLCCREFEQNNVFFKDYLPLDLFKVILELCGIRTLKKQRKNKSPLKFLWNFFK